MSAKDRCYPDDIQVSDYSAEVPLQPLLQHTAQRLGDAQIKVLTGWARHLVVEFFSLHLGMMSEEAQEASNVYFKK